MNRGTVYSFGFSFCDLLFSLMITTVLKIINHEFKATAFFLSVILVSPKVPMFTTWATTCAYTGKFNHCRSPLTCFVTGVSVQR